MKGCLDRALSLCSVGKQLGILTCSLQIRRFIENLVHSRRSLVSVKLLVTLLLIVVITSDGVMDPVGGSISCSSYFHPCLHFLFSWLFQGQIKFIFTPSLIVGLSRLRFD